MPSDNGLTYMHCTNEVSCPQEIGWYVSNIMLVEKDGAILCRLEDCTNSFNCVGEGAKKE